jgi:hypothetical protein
VDAGFGVGITLYADRFAGSFSGPSVGGSALAADRETAQMPDAAITFDGLEPFEVQADFAAEIAFDDVFAFLDGVNDLGKLLFVEVFGTERGIDLCAFEDGGRVDGADAIDIAEGNVNAFLGWNINTEESWHKAWGLTLSLFMARVRADDADDTFTFDDFAVFAKPFD